MSTELISYCNTWPCLILIVLLVSYLYIFIKNRRPNKLLGLIPGPKAKYPLINNLDLLLFNKSENILNSFHYTIADLAKRYFDHGIFKLRLGPITRVFIYRSDLFEILLKDNINIEKSSEYKIAEDWFGKGLGTSNGESWSKMRKLLTPAFHFKIIEQYIESINEKANILVEKLNEISKEEYFDLCPFILRCTLDIVCETSLGFQIDSQKIGNHSYIEASHRLNETLVTRTIKPWLGFNWIFYRTQLGKQYRKDLKIVHDLSRKIIDERKQYFLENRKIIETKKNNNQRLCLLDLLLDKHLTDNSVTDQNIFDEVNTFISGGTDTCASALSWIFYLIGQNQSVQKRLQKELDSIVADNEDITTDQLNQMDYLDAVLKESLRLYPPIRLIMRRITQEIDLGQYVVPEGVTVQLCIAILHMDPNEFPDPSVFNPDRFIGENSIKSERIFSLIPFSAGPRICISKKLAINQLKIIVSKVLLNFNLSSIDKINEMSIVYGSKTTSLNGIRMNISPRH